MGKTTEQTETFKESHVRALERQVIQYALQNAELLRVLKYLSVEMAEQDEADDYAQWINTIETTIASVKQN